MTTTTTPTPRLWPHDDAIRDVGTRFLARILPKAEWTHEAHISTTCWLILERGEIAPKRDLPDLIRRYNESVGGVNSDTEGYHETITRVFIRILRTVLAKSEGQGLSARVNAVLEAPEGQRDWPLRFYSRELLFSKEARLGWVEPDLGPFPPS
ncbi:hypothetical protein [Allosphingosinicella sp.]|uniref:hypothetical protein n=1 Tax=Allosphingosinicella sp. TaxID=2823234 RepID=UPI00378374AF